MPTGDDDYRGCDDDDGGDDGNVKIMELSCLLEVLFTMYNIRAFSVRCFQFSHPRQLSLLKVLCVHFGPVVW
jgi:hypothetical protein